MLQLFSKYLSFLFKIIMLILGYFLKSSIFFQDISWINGSIWLLKNTNLIDIILSNCELFEIFLKWGAIFWVERLNWSWFCRGLTYFLETWVKPELKISFIILFGLWLFMHLIHQKFLLEASVIFNALHFDLI